MSEVYWWLSISLVFQVLFVYSRSFSVSTSACFSMTPEHGNSVPQTSVAKIQIVPHQIKINRGQDVKVSLQRTSNNSFRGFFVQARNINNNEIVGSFVSRDHNVISCYSPSSTAIHRNPSAKENQMLIWKAPKHFSGYVRF
jgi:hypothetical protein